MSEQECCGNCRFSLPREDYVGEYRIWCRRNPPTVIKDPSQWGAGYHWPSMFPSQWCGEWKAKEEDGP